MKQVYVVPSVQAEVDTLIEQLGGALPEVEMLANRTWKFTWDNDRVRVFLKIQAIGNGRIRWAESKLWVDGQARPTLFRDQFTMLWNGATYEEAARADVAEPTRYRPSEIRGKRPVSEAPQDLQKIINAFAEGLKHRDVEMEYGFSDGYHVIGFEDKEEKTALRYIIERKGFISRGAIELWVRGFDLSDQVGGDIDKAIALLCGEAPGGGAVGHPGIGRASGAAVPTTGVTVRKTTVIRN